MEVWSTGTSSTRLQPMVVVVHKDPVHQDPVPEDPIPWTSTEIPPVVTWSTRDLHTGGTPPWSGQRQRSSVDIPPVAHPGHVPQDLVGKDLVPVEILPMGSTRWSWAMRVTSTRLPTTEREPISGGLQGA